MIVDLVPEFFAAAAAADPLDAYRRYFEAHRPVLDAYWRNYILDPESSQALDAIRRAVRAERRDLHALLDRVNLRGLAEETVARCGDVYQMDCPVDVYLMIGVGGANAGELVVGGRGVVFVCLEHFTGRPNADTHGLGLSPDQLPLWIAHEIAHTVRYTSPQSRSELAGIVADAGGHYDYWESGSRATLAEMLVNEGVAVAASKWIAPDFDLRDHLGYSSRQYRRLRELEAFLRGVIADELHATGVGYRLRYFAGGTSPVARLVRGKVIPERAGYYLGYRMVEAYVAEHGIAEALRASASECLETDRRQTGAQSA